VRHYGGGAEVGKINLPFGYSIITSSDVRALKDRVDPLVRALDNTVYTCPAVAAIAPGWIAVSMKWRTYFDGEDSGPGTLPAPEPQMTLGEAYEKEVASWQASIARYRCDPNARAPMPKVPPQTYAPPPDASPKKTGLLPPMDKKTADTLALAAVGLAALLLLSSK
jgi:hypothetical protein